MNGSSDQAGLNGLLRWGVENSDTSGKGDNTSTTQDADKGLNAHVLAQLLGGPSDADLMRESMLAITLPLEESSLDNKLVAWDNFEQLVEQIDNANNLDALDLWKPLLGQLGSEQHECRMYAAWCLSTAVQNNIKCQELLLAKGAIPTLLDLSLNDEVESVRRKAANALSSGVRNFQPAFDELLNRIPDDIAPGSKRLDASDMDQVNSIINPIRERASRAR